MSEGGIDVDEIVRKRRRSAEFGLPIKDPLTGYIVARPSLPPGDDLLQAPPSQRGPKRGETRVARQEFKEHSQRLRKGRRVDRSGRLQYDASGRLVISFGKYRGKLLKDVPRGYLEWMLKNILLDYTAQRIVKNELGRRGISHP